MGKIEERADGTPLTKSEMEEVDRLTKDLYSPTTIDPFTGKKTNIILKTLGVKSPSLKGRVKICSDPETWVVPKNPVAPEDMDRYIKKARIKYGLNRKKSRI